ncbi:MAG TPA: hypothetical protein VMN81_07910 [Vicinamibacterales bacterium]|nr:hypothetical protein [Vicinamibacterales bacterium]
MASKFLAAAACSLLITEAAARPQQPAAARLEDRMRDYIARFEQDASALVAEEHYVQRLRVTRDWRPQGERVRQLRSDYVLVKPADSQAWLGYRDIFEVDGRAVRDREQRVVKVLSGTAPDSRERALALVEEGARFNLGPVRTTNVPTMPLQLLARAHAGRFTIRVPENWERKETVELTFEETARPTIVRTPEGVSVESRGSVTVRVADGAILKATVRFDFPAPPSSALSQVSGAGMTVTYGEVTDVTLPVPLRMSESVGASSAGSSWSIAGTATYSKYRRFQTTTRIR